MPTVAAVSQPPAPPTTAATSARGFRSRWPLVASAAGLIAITNQIRVLNGSTPLDGPTQTLPRLYQLPAADFHDIVGGGNKNQLLNRLTREKSGLDVVLGSSESTTIGNFAIQLAALDGEWVPGIGVPAEGVAKWAQQLTAISVAIPAGAR